MTEEIRQLPKMQKQNLSFYSLNKQSNLLVIQNTESRKNTTDSVVLYHNNNNNTTTNSLDVTTSRLINNNQAYSNSSSDKNWNNKPAKSFFQTDKTQGARKIYPFQSQGNMSICGLKSKNNTCFDFDYYDYLKSSNNPYKTMEKIRKANSKSKFFNSMNFNSSNLNRKTLFLQNTLVYSDSNYYPKKHLKLSNVKLRQFIVTNLEKPPSSIVHPKVSVCNSKVFDYKNNKYSFMHKIIQYPEESKFFNQIHGFQNHLNQKFKMNLKHIKNKIEL